MFVEEHPVEIVVGTSQYQILVGTDFLAVFDHSPGEDETAKRGISAVDGQISTRFSLLQYTCTRDKKLFRDHKILRHLHWPS